ncbi:hypothetical protein V5799_024117 [Amblyomma americanum]|uniref:CCHC-type domain-containing protein n=1 Tax=Amblyomma americanum TaxID=6943 RepID=A0AAQ4EDI5_AMBAM
MGKCDETTQRAKIVRGLNLPDDANVPLWSAEVESMFVSYNVPHDSRLHLIMPALTKRVRYPLQGLVAEERYSHSAVKAAVLNALKLTPAQYLEHFEKALKKTRQAETEEEIVSLADRMKAGLSAGGLEYIPLREGKKRFTPQDLGGELDTFEDAKGRGAAVRQPVTAHEHTKEEHDVNQEKRTGSFECREVGHIARNCPLSGRTSKSKDNVHETGARTHRAATASHQSEVPEHWSPR